MAAPNSRRAIFLSGNRYHRPEEKRVERKALARFFQFAHITGSLGLGSTRKVDGDAVGCGWQSCTVKDHAGIPWKLRLECGLPIPIYLIKTAWSKVVRHQIRTGIGRVAPYLQLHQWLSNERHKAVTLGEEVLQIAIVHNGPDIQIAQRVRLTACIGAEPPGCNEPGIAAKRIFNPAAKPDLFLDSLPEPDSNFPLFVHGSGKRATVLVLASQYQKWPSQIVMPCGSGAPAGSSIWSSVAPVLVSRR